jgi:serine/threonine protein phosphatase PrpC
MPLTTPHRTENALFNARPLPVHEGCRFSAASLTGVQAALNQDSYVCRVPDFFAVADGVGGGALGEVASAMLVRQLAQLHAPDPADVALALKAADEAIAHRLVQEGQGPGAAVCAAVWRVDAKASDWLAMTVGDCKVMIARWTGTDWRIRWASPSQSYAHCGLTPPPGVPPESPANMVGCGLPLPALYFPITLADGERLLLSSDGFHNAFSDEDLQNLLNETPSPLSSASAQAWCQKAQERGSVDDVTVLVVETALLKGDKPKWWWALACLSIMVLAFLPWVLL